MVLHLLSQLLRSKLGAVLQASCLQIWSDRRLLGDRGATETFIKVLERIGRGGRSGDLGRLGQRMV